MTSQSTTTSYWLGSQRPSSPDPGFWLKLSPEGEVEQSYRWSPNKEAWVPCSLGRLVVGSGVLKGQTKVVTTKRRGKG